MNSIHTIHSAAERLDVLYRESAITEKPSNHILTEGLMSIYGEEYHNITRYQSWLRKVILMVENINISVSITTVDEKQVLIYVNKAFETLTQYTRDEVVGQNCRFLQGQLPSIYEKTARQTIAHTIASKHTCKVLITNYKKDGTKFRNLLLLFPIKNTGGELCFYMGIQCDITSELTSFNHVMVMDDLVTIIPKVIREDVVDDFPTDIVIAVKSWLKVMPEYNMNANKAHLPRITSSCSLLAPPSTPQNSSRSPRYKSHL